MQSLPKIVENSSEEIRKKQIESQSQINYTNKKQNPYDYFNSRISKQAIENFLKHEKDDRFIYFLKYGILRRFEGEGDIIFIEIPQIPKKLVVYRRPIIRQKSYDKLYLNSMDLPHVPLFEGEENLKLLSLENNTITKLDHLVSLNNLLYLNLYANKIYEIENLHTVPKLRAIMLGKNQIEKIKNLNWLLDLEVLDLHSNKIKIIENLSMLKKLRLLNLANNQITGFSELINNKNLEEINLRKNLIVSVPYQIYSLEKLKKINLGKNMISKLDYLLELKKLKSLNELVIEDNPVLVLKESGDVLRCLPIKVKLKESRDQKTKPLSPAIGGITSHSSTAGGSINNKAIQGTPSQSISNSNLNSNFLLKSNYSMNAESNNNLNSININNNISSSLNFNNSVSLSGTNSLNNITNSLLLNNNLLNSNNVIPNIMYQTNKSNLIQDDVQVSSSTNNTTTNLNNGINNINNNNNNIPNIVNNQTNQKENTNNNIDDNNSDIVNIVSHIQKEWQTEYNFIVENGYNGYHSKRLKDSKIVSGHAELEGTNKLNIYGNALEVLDQIEFYENISIIHFEYFNIDMITNRKIIEKLKKFVKITKLIFSNNNIHSFYQLLKFEDFNDIESITIINNEINNANLLKFFLIYRFQKIKFYNDTEISSKDVLTAKKIYEYFDKCISCGENKKREKKQLQILQQQINIIDNPGVKEKELNSKDNNFNGNNINQENLIKNNEKSPLDKIENYEIVKEEKENLFLKRNLFNFITKHLTDVLEEIVDEE